MNIVKAVHRIAGASFHKKCNRMASHKNVLTDNQLATNGSLLLLVYQVL